jgi:ABC-type nitrate/sulfonate/bicarbonate transport system ATPase subunit
VLLDDVLSALDVHTSRWVVDKCFAGDLLRGRTVVLVTHNVALAGPLANFVVSIGSDGKIVSQGSVGEALSRNLVTENENEMRNSVDGATDNVEALIGNGKASGKLMTDEEVALGHISPAASGSSR